MLRMLGESRFHLIQHLRIQLPHSYESWSNDPTTPYVSLKTLTVVIGLSRLGSQRLPSETTNAEFMKETVENSNGRHMTDFTRANFENGLFLMWTPPESFVYNYFRRRDEVGGKYSIYVQSRPDVLSELERKDFVYKQELAFLRLCLFDETEPRLP